MSIYRMATVDVLSYEETASDSYTKLLLHCDGANGSTTFTDKTGKTVTRYGDAQISTAQSKFRGASAKFDGTGDYLTIPTSTDFDFGSADMTIDFWFKTTQTTKNATLITREWVSSPWYGGWSIQLNGDTAGSPMLVFWSDYSTGSPFMTSSINTYRDGLWHHVAWVKNGNVHCLYIDGVQAATNTVATTFATVTKNITIGNDLTFGSGARCFNGNIDELRVSKGIARWTSAFTPPTAPYDTTITQTPTNTNVAIKQQFRGLSGVNREIKAQYRGYSGVNRLVFGSAKTYLYNAGDECTALTGGWSYSGYTFLSSEPGISAIKETTDIKYTSSYDRTMIGANNLIDLTPYTKIKTKWTLGTAMYIYLTCSTTKTYVFSNAVAYTQLNNVIGSPAYAEIDVSALNGNYYFATTLYRTGATASGYLLEAWLE